jgi:peptide/nickel transport system substrate-binding protein
MKKIVDILCITMLVMSFALSALISSPVQSVPSNPKWGGTFIFSSDYEQKSLNPNIVQDDQAMRLAQMGFLSPLLAIDYIGGTSEMYPILAESWEVNEDATVFTFHLFHNISWHDGVKFTSADVLWTINKIVDESGFSSNYFEDMQSIEAPDDYTVKITLNNPNAAFLNLLGGYYAPTILPKHLYEGTDWTTNPYNQAPIGTGPFKFVEWVKGHHTTFEAYDDYHLGRPYLDRIIFRAPVPYQTAIPMLRAGEVAMAGTNIPAAEAMQLAEDPDFQNYLTPDNILIHVIFNPRREPFDNYLVRKAICHAINITDVTYRVTLGTCKPAEGYWFKDHWAFNSSATQPEYDPTLAEQLLDQAGYPRDPGTGIRFSTTLGSHTNPFVDPCKPIIKEMLYQVGIDASLYTMTWPEYSEKVVTRKDYDLAFLGGICGPDPVEFEKFVMTGGYRNTPGYNNSRIDELMELGRSTSVISERAVYYQEVQQILSEYIPRLNVYEWYTPHIYSIDYGGMPEDPEATGPGYHINSYFRLYWKSGSTRTPLETWEHIEAQEDEIADLEEQNYTITAATAKLDEAKAAYDSGDYDEAYSLATLAPSLAVAPGEEPPPNGGGYGIELVIAVAAVVAIIVGVGTYIVAKRKPE